jgi:hypothetical protein
LQHPAADDSAGVTLGARRDGRLETRSAEPIRPPRTKKAK